MYHQCWLGVIALVLKTTYAASSSSTPPRYFWIEPKIVDSPHSGQSFIRGVPFSTNDPPTWALTAGHPLAAPHIRSTFFFHGDSPNAALYLRGERAASSSLINHISVAFGLADSPLGPGEVKPLTGPLASVTLNNNTKPPTVIEDFPGPTSPWYHWRVENGRIWVEPDKKNGGRFYGCQQFIHGFDLTVMWGSAHTNESLPFGCYHLALHQHYVPLDTTRQYPNEWPPY